MDYVEDIPGAHKTMQGLTRNFAIFDEEESKRTMRKVLLYYLLHTCAALQRLH